jgi:hypothetical protein
MGHETALDGTTDRIHELHELSFHFIEEKKNGADSVSMSDYEYLLNHYIEFLQDMRDAIVDYGDKYYCGKCSVEVKGGET